MASLPAKTQAIQYSAYGGPEVIKFNEINTPVPKEDEVLVRVEWGAVNFIDTYFRTGAYPVQQHPFTSGQEASGEIVALPPLETQSEDFKSRGLNVGDKVVFLHPGSFKTFTVVPYHKISVIPKESGMSTELAAGGFSGALTAVTLMKEAYEVKRDDWILVHAAAGGLGLMLCQVGKHLGANVIGTTSTEEKAKVAREHGADHVILYTKSSIVDEVLKLTGGQGVHAVFDGVGKDTWEDNFSLIARKGTIVSFGASSGLIPPFSPMKLVAKNIKLLRPSVFNYLATPAEFIHYTTQCFNLFINHGLKVKIHKTYPFSVEGVTRSQEDLTGRGTMGRSLINIGEVSEFETGAKN